MRDESWKPYQLSDLADMCLGKMLDQKKNKGEFYPYLANVNVQWGKINLENLKKMKFKSTEFVRYGLNYGDIVMCEGGEPGRCAIWKEQTNTMMIQKALHRIRAKSIVDSYFLYYSLFFKGVNGYFDGYFTGSAIKHLTGQNLAKIIIEIPPLSTQRKIATILSAYDDLIENNLKRIKLLEEKAQLTYEEWFVRMKFPGYKNTPINEETRLPEGWEKVELQELVNVVTGKTPSTTKTEYYGNDIPFIKTPDLHASIYMANVGQHLSYLGANSQRKKFFPKNTILLACIGARAGAVGLTSTASQCNQQINGMLCKAESLTFYVYFFSRALTPLLRALGSNGATMTNVSKGKLERVNITKPTSDIISDFHNHVKNEFEIILNLQTQNQLLKEARDLLLPRLMTGMIDVDAIV